MEQKKVSHQITKRKLKQIKRKYYPKKSPEFQSYHNSAKKLIRFQKISKKNVPNSIFNSFLYSFSLSHHNEFSSNDLAQITSFILY